jgi:hypothetical protein
MPTDLHHELLWYAAPDHVPDAGSPQVALKAEHRESVMLGSDAQNSEFYMGLTFMAESICCPSTHAYRVKYSSLRRATATTPRLASIGFDGTTWERFRPTKETQRITNPSISENK